MHLPELPRFDRLDPILQSYLKSRWLSFIYEDPRRTWVYQSLKWQQQAVNNRALAPDIFFASKPATVHAATTAAEQVISDETAEAILQILWNEFRSVHKASYTSSLHHQELFSQIMTTFHSFVYQDEDRKTIFEEWLKWKKHTGKDRTFAEGIPAPMLTMDHTATGSEQVIHDESAELIMLKLWTGLNEQMHLPRLPRFDRLDPIIQTYLKLRMLAFVREDQDRTRSLNEWLKTWQHKASSNGASALDIFSASMPARVHGTTAAGISDGTAKVILQILWSEFKHVQEADPKSSFHQPDFLSYMTLPPAFHNFVYKDEDRKTIFEEWLKWHKHTGKDRTSAQGIPASMSTMDHTATGTEYLLPDETAKLAMPALWDELKDKMNLPELPRFDQLDPLIQSYLMSRMLAYVREDQGRTWLFNEWWKWERKATNNEPPGTDIFSAFILATIPATTAAEEVISDETAKVIRKILENEYERQNHVLGSDHKSLFDMLDLISQTLVTRDFFNFASQDKIRKRLFDEWLNWKKTH
ncbi:hypothetical protein PsorP6_009693 [Peronosclerospora sorghi]|uniref:Uncharacterized protein n=1 Tax=Peronosclerospora sorghi TaxID=230839 RepID=A0ACC0VZ11_9STRA|nr:hypothetical protein PsorP6_009693 [Peronosclerospora sorghi]